MGGTSNRLHIVLQLSADCRCDFCKQEGQEKKKERTHISYFRGSHRVLDEGLLVFQC